MCPTKIDWAEFTWNPLVGCERRCEYCYVPSFQKRIYKSNSVQFFENRLSGSRSPEARKKSTKIFVCSMADLFGPWVWNSTIQKVIDVAWKCPQHTFIFLTKFPQRYREFVFPINCWTGMTVTGIENDLDSYYDALAESKSIKFVSYEPILGFSFLPPYNSIHFREQKYRIDWVILGAMTGNSKFIAKMAEKFNSHRPILNKNRGVLMPPNSWIEGLLKQADNRKIPVFLKDNLTPGWPRKLRREYP